MGKPLVAQKPERIPRRFVWLPILAGLLHLHVFYRASSFLIATISIEPLLEIEPSVALYSFMELSVLLAYGFDFLCLACSVIPYSRCKEAKDIIIHHTPVFVLLLPLGVPMWAKWTSWEPMLPMLQTLEGVKRHYGIVLLLRANALGFVSSLNEAIMCFQRAELSLQGVRTMFVGNDDEQRTHNKPTFWTSRPIEFIELSYKVMIFYVFPMFSIWSTFNTDKFFYSYLRDQHPTASVLSLIGKTFMSPLQIRSVIWRLFIFLMYPKLGRRTLGKLNRFLHHEPVMGKAL